VSQVHIFSWKAKVGISIFPLLAPEKGLLEKVIIPFDSP
jgi:hypothetical protein